MLLKPIFVVALIGHCLARADPSRSTAQNDARKPMLIYATNGEGKTLEAEKKSGFRRSIPPGAGLGFAGGFGNGGFNTGIGTGFVPNGGMNFGTGLGLGTGLPNNNFMGSSFGPVGLGNNFVGTGYTGASFGSAGLGNNILGTGFAGTSFGVDAMSNPFGYSNSMIYSPYGNNMGGFGVNTRVFNQPGLGTSYWPNQQGLMTNGFNGVGVFNDPSGFNSLGINGNSFGGVNSFRNGATGLNGLNGIGTGGLNGLNGIGSGVGFNNNFGSLSNGINGFSSANSLNNRFGTGFNNGLNNFSSFNTGVSSSGFGNPSLFATNSFGESNSFKRSPLDPTSPYYIQLYNSENNEEGQSQSSNWNSRNSGLPATNRDTSAAGTVTSHSAGGQVRSNSGSV